MKFNNLMLDIETYGVEQSTTIISISAVPFDIVSGNFGDVFDVNINTLESAKYNFTTNAETIEWWSKQSEEAKNKLKQNQLPIDKACKMFVDFCSKYMHPDFKIWGNGANFDIGILSNTMQVLSIPLPWKYNKVRDVRTISALYPEYRASETNVGTLHNGIYDCIFQINYVSKIFRHVVKTKGCKIIVAVNNLGYIGLNGTIPWKCSDDLKHFASKTKGCKVMCGSKTKESLPELKDREILVVGNNYMTLDDALLESPQWIIGGESIYSQVVDLCSEIHISKINDNTIGDKKFTIPPTYEGSVITYEFNVNS